MSEFNISSKRGSLLIRILLAVLLVFVALIVARHFLSLKVLKSSEEYIESLKKVFEKLQEPSLTGPVFKVTDPRLGNVGAEHLIVVYSDFQCPYCADSFGALMQLFNQYPSKLSLIWKDLANPLHPQASPAAIAARCAQVQNKFWDYGAYLYANQESLGKELYVSIADTLNLDSAEFNQCLAGQETLPLVEDGFQEASALKIDGTPFLFIDGARYAGLISFIELEKMVK